MKRAMMILTIGLLFAGCSNNNKSNPFEQSEVFESISNSEINENNSSVVSDVYSENNESDDSFSEDNISNSENSSTTESEENTIPDFDSGTIGLPPIEL